MIWTTADLPKKLKSRISGETVQTHFAANDVTTIRVAIVGAGPKGMYALDSLLVELSNHNLTIPLIIDWYDKADNFGAGPNYQTSQSDNLLINYAIGNINAWTTSNEHRRSLTDWLIEHTKANPLPSPTDYASRAVVGYYLKDCCQTIIDQLPANISLNRFKKEVTNITTTDERKLKIDQFTYDSIILCTGHSYKSKFYDQNNEQGPIYEAYPMDRLENLISLQKIAIQGMGLSFIDSVITLAADRDLADIPTMYPFSRTNLPMIPRLAQVGNKQHQFLYPTYWESLVKRRSIDFDEDVFPKLNEEVCHAYAMEESNLTCDNTALGDKPKNSTTQPFSLLKLMFPNQYLAEKDEENYNDWILKYLKEEVDRCQNKKFNNRTAALEKLAQFRPILEQIYAYGKLNEESHLKFDKYWYPAISRLCFGPPIKNVEKLIKLIEVGKLVFNFVETPKVEIKNNKVILRDNRNKVECDALIYAHIPKSNLPDTTHKLYSNLIANGLAQVFYNQNYCTGAIAIDRQGILISKYHNYLLFAYGTATEGCVLDNDTLSRKAHNFAIHWVAHIVKKVKEQSKLKENETHESL